MPVREIRANARSLTGVHADSGKRGIAYESSLERDFITLMLFDRNTVSVEEQPVAVPVPGAIGRASTYVTDFIVDRRVGAPILVEVKYADELKEKAKEYERRFAAAKQFASRRGWKFEIWTEKEIRTVQFENAQFLLPYRHEFVREQVRASILQSLSDNKNRFTVDGLVNQLGKNLEAKGKVLRTIWCLIAIGIINVDMTQTIDMETSITISSGSK